jgi:hypothetical protein
VRRWLEGLEVEFMCDIAGGASMCDEGASRSRGRRFMGNAIRLGRVERLGQDSE